MRSDTDTDTDSTPTGLSAKNEASDSDDEIDISPSQPPTSDDKHKTQNAFFRRWMLQQAEAELSRPKRQKSSKDEQMSIRELVSQNESQQIITDPREYQLELFERAKRQNTIAVLDTGSGKTLIAVLLLRHIIDQELEDRLAGREPRIAFFIVPSVNLVFQQSAVLECNLDHKIGSFCGAMQTDLWTKPTWNRHFVENKVIVCTAEVLHQCLAHAFIAIEQINLIVFDEAHHTKLEHPYSKIIKGYYAPSQSDRRPRIFGMTASPVDAKVDVVQAAQDLESLLHSRIATTRDLSLLRKTVHRADEEKIYYQAPPLHEASDTTLQKELRARFGHLHILEKLFFKGSMIKTHLGSWCADFFWKVALQQSATDKAEDVMHRDQVLSSKHAQDKLNSDLALFKDALQVVDDLQVVDPTLASMSAKVGRLHDFLQMHFERATKTRCIVFVEQRDTAKLLHKLFEHTGSPHLRPGSLVGHGTTALGNVNASFREQVVIMMKFGKGDVNCLFATSVAEEGLDVPDCNLVIRFDRCKTMIQYIQARGRARHQNSKYVHMLERGNVNHEQLLEDHHQAEHLMRCFCEQLPSDRYLQGNDGTDGVSDNNCGTKSYTVKSTGAKITFANCLQLLSQFVSALPHDGDEKLHPSYVSSVVGAKFVCEVILPSCSPLHRMMGDARRRKSLAKCSAAFNACVELIQQNFLDENLLPIYEKRIHPLANAALALKLKEAGQYALRIKPSFWGLQRGNIPRQLYASRVEFSHGLERAYQPIIILTRQPLPSLPRFPLFLDSGLTSHVILSPSTEPIDISEEEVERLTVYTLRIFKDMFNKTYERDSKNMSYWLVPALSESKSEVLDPKNILDWDAVAKVDAEGVCRWSADMPPEYLEDKYFVDPHHGAIRYFSGQLAPHYRPSDPVPSGTVEGKHMDSILSFTVSLWKKARARAVWSETQPVLEAEKVMIRRNMLAQDRSSEITTKRCFICPEPLIISPLTPAFVTSCLAFPAVIHRIDDYLISLELCSRLGLRVEPSLALEAVTKDSDNSSDDQHHERIKFQRGMGKNYERLEFLGDCFLKTATTLSTFVLNPNDNEFESHVKRMLMLCNQNLFNVAMRNGITEYIRSQSFSRRTWYPEGLKLLEGKGHTKDGIEVVKHDLGEKTIADVCEALIGAAFLTHNKPGNWKPEHWTDAVGAVTKLVDNETHKMTQWSDYMSSYQKPDYQIAVATAAQLDLALKVEQEHAYHFRYPRLLRSAFLHPSYPFMWEKVPNYQRLEFLGDALLDLAFITHLFYRYPEKDPQWLTEHKMAMVSNKFLAVICVKLGFHRHLRYHSPDLEPHIRSYTIELAEAERISGGAKDYWTLVSDPPKCLADMVEAYVGAMFLDSDFDYSEVERFFNTHMKSYFEDMTIYDTFATTHPIVKIFKMMEESFGCHEFRLMADEIPSGDGKVQIISGLMIHNQVIAGEIGKSARYSKIRTAMKAADELSGIAPFQFRAKFGCDCSKETILSAEMSEVDHGSAI